MGGTAVCFFGKTHLSSATVKRERETGQAKQAKQEQSKAKQGQSKAKQSKARAKQSKGRAEQSKAKQGQSKGKLKTENTKTESTWQGMKSCYLWKVG